MSASVNQLWSPSLYSDGSGRGLTQDSDLAHVSTSSQGRGLSSGSPRKSLSMGQDQCQPGFQSHSPMQHLSQRALGQMS